MSDFDYIPIGEKELKEAAKKKHELYRYLFFRDEKTKLGFAVLLNDMCHFKKAETDEQIHLKNFSTHLMNTLLGCNGYNYVDAISMIRDYEIPEEGKENE